MSLAALLRVDPELRGRSLAVADGSTTRSVIRALSPEAMAAGMCVGMTVAQARVADAEVVIRPFREDVLRAASATLSDVARTISARVEQADDGTVFFDCEGSGALCASETELAAILGARAERQGLPAWVGIADSKLAARIAAREGRGAEIMLPGTTRMRLASLPVGLLDPDAVLAATLASWGVRTIGDLAALPVGAVAHRLGPAGARLARLARGEEDEPLHPQALPHSFSEALQLDYGIERLDPLVFVLRRLVDYMMGRLALHGLTCAALDLHLDLANGGRYVRRLPLAAPTTDCKTLLTVLRAHLESEPPTSAVHGLAIAGVAARLRPVQLDFFQPNGPAPAALAATIARLAALCGADRIGTPLCFDSHRPDAATLVPFTGDVGSDSDTGASPSPISGEGPADDTIDDSSGARRGIVAPVALRAFRPPAALEVFECAGRLDYVRGRGFGGRVVHQAGPWRLRGEWWTVDPFAREYYDVELSDGGVYRIYRDVRRRCWCADGIYD